MPWPTMKDLETFSKSVPEVGAALEMWKRGNLSLEVSLTGLCVLLAAKVHTQTKSQTLRERATVGEVLRNINRNLPSDVIKRDLPADPNEHHPKPDYGL